MHTDPSIKTGDLGIEPTSLDGAEKSIQPVNHETNVTEGSEFLNDALRMDDLDPPIKEDEQASFQSNKTFYYEFY